MYKGVGMHVREAVVCRFTYRIFYSSITMSTRSNSERIVCQVELDQLYQLQKKLKNTFSFILEKPLKLLKKVEKIPKFQKNPDKFAFEAIPTRAILVPDQAR